MSNEPVVELEVEAPRVDPPGKRLRAGREAVGMSQSDVSVQLRLPVATIDALEHDRYDALPESIFVRGYLRSYATLLELAVDDVLESYNQTVGAQPQPHLHSQRMPSQVGSGHRRMRYASALIVVLLAALVAVWWYNNELFRPQPIPPQPATGAPAADTAGGTGPAADTAGGTRPATDVAAPTAPQPAPSVSQTPSDQAAPPVSDAGGTESAAPEGPAGAASPAPASSPAAANKSEAAAATAGPPAAKAEPRASAPAPAAVTAQKPPPAAGSQAAASGGDTLRLSFDGSSWVEVRDATGKRLLYQLSRKGDVETVTGKAPFRVLLGNSPAVEVQYNGEPFDQSAYNTRGNTARFEVGK